MQIAQFNTALDGGAAIAARRLHDSLEEYSVDSVFYFRQGSPLGPTYRSFYGKGGFAPSQVKKLFLRKASSLLSLLASRKSVKGYDLFTYPGLFHGMKDLKSFSSVPEILHLHWIAYFIDFPSFFRSLPESMPIVWTLHDMNPFTGGCHYSWGCDRFQTKCHDCPQLVRPSNRDLSRRGFDIKLNSLKNKNLHVVADSYWLENQARSSTIFKHARSIQTIHYGLDVDVFSPDDKIQSKRALGIDPDRVVVAFGADSISWRRKGMRELQRALGLLQVDNLSLLLFGQGEPVESDNEFPTIHTGPIQSESRLRTIYSAADIFVIPSLYEAFGQTALEAMACGTPVVGFDTGGIPDMVKPGETGLLAQVGDHVDLAEKIQYLIDNAGERLRMGANARKLAESCFTLEKQAKKYIELYESILEKGA